MSWVGSSSLSLSGSITIITSIMQQWAEVRDVRSGPNASIGPHFPSVWSDTFLSLFLQYHCYVELSLQLSIVRDGVWPNVEEKENSINVATFSLLSGFKPRKGCSISWNLLLQVFTKLLQGHIHIVKVHNHLLKTNFGSRACLWLFNLTAKRR